MTGDQRSSIEDGSRSADSGSASIWVLACAALLLVVSAITAVRAAAVVARHRVESAADLAALAGAGQIGAGGAVCAAAARIARRNGASLRSCASTLDASGRSGAVTVRVAAQLRLPVVGVVTVSASARAGRLPAA